MGTESSHPHPRGRRILLVVALVATLGLGCDWLDSCNRNAAPTAEQLRQRYQQDLETPVQQEAPAPAPEPEPAPSGGAPAAAAAEPAMQIDNPLAVQNGGKAPTWKAEQSMKVTEISTYHWNDGKGKTPGTLGLKAADGTEYGPWQTSGLSGQGGVPNATWVAKPNEVIPPGSYKVVDSDPGSWSQNEKSGGKGFTTIIAAPTQ